MGVFPVNERTSTLYTANLVDERNRVIAGDLDTLVLTLYEPLTDTILNSRDGQNVLNVNGVTIAPPMTLSAVSNGGTGFGYLVQVTTLGPHGLTNLDINTSRQQVWLVVNDSTPVVRQKVVINVTSSTTFTVGLLTLTLGGVDGYLVPLPNLQWLMAPADNAIVLTEKSIENHLALFKATWDSGAKTLNHAVTFQVTNLGHTP